MSEVIKILFAALVGAGITGFGYYYKVRAEKIKIINKTVYYLVHLWHALANIEYLSTEKVSTNYVDELNKEMKAKNSPNIATDQEKELFAKLSKKVMDYHLQAIHEKTIKDSGDLFEKHIPELSKFYPIIAQKVGKLKYLIDLRNVIEETNLNTKESLEKMDCPAELASRDDFIKGFQDGSMLSQNHVSKELVGKIESLLYKTISWELCIWTGVKLWFEIRRIKKKLKGDLPKKELEKIKKQLEKII